MTRAPARGRRRQVPRWYRHSPGYRNRRDPGRPELAPPVVRICRTARQRTWTGPAQPALLRCGSASPQPRRPRNVCATTVVGAPPQPSPERASRRAAGRAESVRIVALEARTGPPPFTKPRRHLAPCGPERRATAPNPDYGATHRIRHSRSGPSARPQGCTKSPGPCRDEACMPIRHPVPFRMGCPAGYRSRLNEMTCELSPRCRRASEAGRLRRCQPCGSITIRREA